jgi:hypothetical protein
VRRGDSVLEVGCSTGGATALLAQVAGAVVGVDNSKQLVHEARARAPHIRFELLDALQSPSALADLASEVAACVVFVDIGGNRQVGGAGGRGGWRGGPGAAQTCSCGAARWGVRGAVALPCCCALCFRLTRLHLYAPPSTQPTTPQLSSLVTLLPFIAERLAPRLLVVKSEALAAAAAAQLRAERQGAGAGTAQTQEQGQDQGQQQHAAAAAADPSQQESSSGAGGAGAGAGLDASAAPAASVSSSSSGVSSSGSEARRRPPGSLRDPAAWWAALHAASAAAPIIDNPLFHKARAKGFKGLHPMRFPDRFAPGGTRICRPFNYGSGGCREGAACPFDHAHCHHCLEPGHTARECSR